MTCDTPNSRSIGALISPVNAPSNSQCIVCAPKPMRVSRSRTDADGIDRNGGAMTISTRSGSVAALGRKSSKKASVSAAVLCIFQLPASISLLLKRRNPGKHLAFEIFQRRAAAGGNVRHFGCKSEHVRGGSGVAAADHAERAGRGRACDRVADDFGS